MNHRINDALVAWLRLPEAEQERAANILLDAVELSGTPIDSTVIAF